MMASDVDDRLLISASEVARLLDVSVRTVWRLMAAKKFPQPLRFNRKLVRWRASDVAAWAALSQKEGDGMCAEGDGASMKVFCRNHAGRARERTLTPLQLWHGTTQWHSEPQWFVKCFDEEDGRAKDFALLGFMGPGPITVLQVVNEPMPKGG